jgi:hypothetical protein
VAPATDRRPKVTRQSSDKARPHDRLGDRNIDGDCYVSDTDRLWVIKIAPDRKVSTLVEDPRLLWVDAMRIDDPGHLWMPAAQLNRMAPFESGTSKIEFPVHVYKLQIGQKPPGIDHP